MRHCLVTLLCLVSALPVAGQMATVVGNIQDVTGSGADTTFTLRPQNNPVLIGTNYVSTYEKSVRSTNGLWSTRLVLGNYDVVVSGRNRHVITVPEGTETYQFGDLISSPVRYIYRATGKLIKTAEDDSVYGYLGEKLIAGEGFTITSTNVGSSKALLLSVGAVPAESLAWGALQGDVEDQGDLWDLLEARELALGFVPQGGSLNLTNWGAIATSAKQDALGFVPQGGSLNLTNWGNLATNVLGTLGGSASATNVAFADLLGDAEDNASLLSLVQSRQAGAANLTNWGAIETSAKQDALGFVPQGGSSTLTNWADIDPADKAAAIHNHAGSEITNGTVDNARLPAAISVTSLTAVDGHFGTLDVTDGFTVGAGNPGATNNFSGPVQGPSAKFTNTVEAAEFLGYIDWNYVTNKPAGFADDTDDGAGGATASDLYFAAGAMRPLLVASAVAGSWEPSGTDAIGYDVFTMGDSADSGVSFSFAWPASWNTNGTCTVVVSWTTAASSGNVEWEVSMGALGDNEAGGSILGSVVTAVDTVQTAGRLHQVTTDEVTAGGTIADNKVVTVKILRDADAASDLTGDAQLVSVLIQDSP